jgi:hypothetical protein
MNVERAPLLLLLSLAAGTPPVGSPNATPADPMPARTVVANLRDQVMQRVAAIDTIARGEGFLQTVQFMNFPNFPNQFMNFPNFPNFPNALGCFRPGWRNC